MTLKLPKHLTVGTTASHARSRIQEKKTALRIGGRQTKASGAKDEKGDVRLKRIVRIECKTTARKSFSVTEEMIQKLEDAVTGSDEAPMLQIEILGGRRKVLVLPDWALEMLIHGVVVEAAEPGQG